MVLGHLPVEMDEAEPCTSSANELVEKSRFRGSLHRVADSPVGGAGLPTPPKTDGAGAELERRARRSGLVDAKLADRGMDWPPPPDVR